VEKAVTLQGLTGQKYELDTKPFRSGGEGDIYYVTNAANSIAKIYHAVRISKELEDKLKIMVKGQPNSSVLSQVAWPLDIVYDANNQFCGFIMPRLNITGDLKELYQYPPQKHKNITIKQKIIIAENICAVISEVHKAGYVFGDFNPQNIGVNIINGTVAFLDTDSFHIYDSETNNTYRCKVGFDGYVAPELLKMLENYPKNSYATAPLPTFTKETDNFALAIHIFRLLMNGFTPFNGIPETARGSTASPDVGNNAIRNGNYCFKPGNKPQAEAVPPLDILPEEIANLFTRAFMTGRIDPKQRPTAIEWHRVLTKYENSLKTCSRNSAHQYKSNLPSCPWCEADERYANSITPPIAQKLFGPSVVSVPQQYGPNVVTPSPSGIRAPVNPGYIKPKPIPTQRKSKKISVIIVACAIIIIPFVFYRIVLNNSGGISSAQQVTQNICNNLYVDNVKLRMTKQANSHVIGTMDIVNDTQHILGFGTSGYGIVMKTNSTIGYDTGDPLYIQSPLDGSSSSGVNIKTMSPHSRITINIMDRDVNWTNAQLSLFKPVFGFLNFTVDSVYMGSKIDCPAKEYPIKLIN